MFVQSTAPPEKRLITTEKRRLAEHLALILLQILIFLCHYMVMVIGEF